MEDITCRGGTIDTYLFGATEVDTVAVTAKKAVKNDSLVESPAVVVLNAKLSASARSSQDRTSPTPQCHVDVGQKKANKFTFGRKSWKRLMRGLQGR